MKNILIFLIITIYACTSNKYIKFALKDKYLLFYDEKILPTKDEDNIFKKYCTIDNLQLMLNRKISSTNTEIYISVSFEANPVDFDKKISSDKNYTIIEKSEYTTGKRYYYFYFVQKDDKYLIRILFLDCTGNIFVLVDLLFNDYNKAKDMYQRKTDIISKFKC